MNEEKPDLGYQNYLKTTGALNYLQEFNIQNPKEYEEIIYKICSVLTTQTNIDNFFKFMNEIYKAGYKKSAGDYQTALEKHGIKFNIS